MLVRVNTQSRVEGSAWVRCLRLRGVLLCIAAESYGPSALLELGHVRGVHGVSVDDDLAHVGHVAAALVIVDEDGDDADVLKLGKVQFDLVLAGGLLSR